MRRSAPVLQACLCLWAAGVPFSAVGVGGVPFDVTRKHVQTSLFSDRDVAVPTVGNGQDTELPLLGQEEVVDSDADSIERDPVDKFSNPWSSGEGRPEEEWTNVIYVDSSVNSHPLDSHEGKRKTRDSLTTRRDIRNDPIAAPTANVGETTSVPKLTEGDLVAQETRYDGYEGDERRGRHYGGGGHRGYRGHGGRGGRHYRDRHGNHHHSSGSRNSYNSYGGYKGHFDRGNRYWRDQGHGLEARYGRQRWGGHHHNRGRRGSRYDQRRRYSDGDQYGGRHSNRYGGRGGGGGGHHRRHGGSHHGDYGRGGSHRGGGQRRHRYGEHQGSYRNGGSRY